MSIYRGKTKKEVYLASQLYDSIDDNNLRAVKSLLIERGANPNIIVPTKGISSFHLVIGSDDGDFALILTRLILQFGGDPNLRSDDGLTPVHIAAAWGRIDILRMLLNCGGDPDCKDSNWMTPIHYAKKENYLDCLDLLRSYMPINFDIINEDKEDCYKYKFDKIFVNNGCVIGEYEVDCNLNLKIETENSINKQRITPERLNLAQLPYSDNTKLILNWFSTHIDDRGGETYIKNTTNSTGNSTEEDFISYESSVDESENENVKKLNTTNLNITFRKVYKKKQKIKRDERSPTKSLSVPIKSEVDSCHMTPSSRCKTNRSSTSPEGPKTEALSIESGILTLAESCFSTKHSPGCQKIEASSDYLTNSTASLLNKNIFAITSDLSANLFTSDDSFASVADNNKIGCVGKLDEVESTDLSFVTVSEVFRYEDDSNGVVLYEKRMIKVSSDYNGSIKTGSLSSKMSSLPESLDYDPDNLRKELTLLGYTPGPITSTTKRVYLKKLYQLKKNPMLLVKQQREITKRVYSAELQRTLREPSWTSDLTSYKKLESDLITQFNAKDPSRKWREGNNKSSFAYLLLDPRKTDNLPCKADIMDPKVVWETFLSAIFYVGKGKRTRPYSHLYDAVTVWKQSKFTDNTKKIQTILDIWRNGSGVICLHVFQNIIPVEAYTREAAMISALKMENITNLKGGDFYGIASTWNGKDKRMLGSYLLYKAMLIFLNEGERQLHPEDID